MESFAKLAGIFVIWVLLVVVVGLVLSLPVMWLWNWALVPAMPVLREIGWLQAWGIMILSGLLFKSAVGNK
jgi:hypothetical protein